jgi:hypothetical protein
MSWVQIKGVKEKRTETRLTTALTQQQLVDKRGQPLSIHADNST